MKLLAALTTGLITSMLSAAALASDAETSASASSSRYQRNGTAAASARYDGQLGFARTRTRSGRINLARGVAVGIDRSGVSLSVSNAIAPKLGPAIGTSFNISIGRDGQVSASRGLSVSQGSAYRSATAGGRASTGRHGRAASALASGKTGRFGRVQATTSSEHYAPRLTVGTRHSPLSLLRRHVQSKVQRVRLVRR